MSPRVELSGAALQDERRSDARLRPETLGEFVGQTRVVDNLRVFIQAALQRGEPMDHALFYGPPGLGKTALAHVVAREMRASLRVTAGPVLERAGDLAAIVTNIEPDSVLFIDEIHRLSPAVEEILYPAMEDFKLDLVIGQGPSAQTVQIDLPPFTLIGATTRAGLLTHPLRARFGVVSRLDYYPPEDLVRILDRSAGILSIGLDPEGAHEIARRARGTPRIANRLLRRVRDFAQVDGQDRITRALAGQALDRLEVDEAGFDAMDRALLRTLIHKYAGGPVGIDTLAAATGEDRGTIEDIYEPFLIQAGYLDRTPRGRVATPRALDHFGVDPASARRAAGAQGRLL